MSILVDIEKKLGTFQLKVRFEAGNETLALLGASGCGKSLTLRCIAGIERPDRGRIVVDGKTLFDSEKHINLPPQQRHVGLMFQNYALFPNMTVEQNIRCGAMRETDKAGRETAVQQVLTSFGLQEYARHYPHQLSGGQQQRVALARMLVSAPNLLLLDEPFSALDSHLRFRLEQEVRDVIRALGKTVVLVSHDRDEVYRMSDSIAIMNEGTIETIGPKGTVFADPKTKAGAILTGCKNISRLERREDGTVWAADWGLSLDLPDLPEEMTHAGIRMKMIRPGRGENAVRCRVVEEIENPFSYTVLLRPMGAEHTVPLGWEMPKDTWRTLRAGEQEIYLPRQSILLLKERSL